MATDWKTRWRHLAEHPAAVLDCYRAAEHLTDFAAVRYPHDESACNAWADQTKGLK